MWKEGFLPCVAERCWCLATGGDLMRKRFLATVFLLTLGIFFAPTPGSEVHAQQQLQSLLSTTVTLPAIEAYQDITVNLVAGNTYYFSCALNSYTGVSYENDPELYLFAPGVSPASTGSYTPNYSNSVAWDDDWGNYNNFPTGVLPAPTNGWGAFLNYTPTVSGAFTLRVTTYSWLNMGVTPAP